MVHWLERTNLEFPPLEQALQQPDGLLAIGGDLSSERLLAAYRHGCFPWYSQGQPIMWWSPDPRFVLFPQQLYISRSLRKNMARQQFRVTYDQAFAQVISACAEPRAGQPGTWITSQMQNAYMQLHELGFAHSVEVWHQQQLVGGLYGIAMGQLFFGESMFSRMSNASKTGFVRLVQDLQQAGFVLIDCQVHTHHLERFGAEHISRASFADYLRKHLDAHNSMSWQQ